MPVWKRNARRAVPVALSMILGALVLAGCSEETRYKVLSFLFEGVPPPGQMAEWKPVIGHPRRPPPRISTPMPTPELAAPVGEFPPGWLPELVKAMPRDEAGYGDMVAALDKGLIKARPGIARTAVAQPLFDKDVVLRPKGRLKISFSHKVHSVWLGCDSCHPKLFQKKAKAEKISMHDMEDGKFCGFCHGTVAFPLEGECRRCHPNFRKSEKKRKQTRTMAGDVTFVRHSNDPATKEFAPATFPHLPHRVAFRCYVCHEQIFPMKREPEPVSMTQIDDGKYCGACHDGKTAFASDNLGNCNLCHRQ